ncbi:MAG: hypothetical protein GX937_10720 [Lentisphaerae bacterium]|nr:hypothetical protein [Lentisphaerota bacterium]
MKFKTAFFAAVLLALAIPLISCLGTSNLAVSSCDRAYLYGRSPVLLGWHDAPADAIPLPLLPLGLSPAAPAPDSDLTPIYHEAAPHVLAYRQAWEELFNTRVLPSLSCPEHGYCLPEMPALAELLKTRLTLEEVEDTVKPLDLALAKAAAGNHTELKEGLEKLFLHHEHAVLQFKVWTTLNRDQADADAMTAGLDAARQLQLFRQNFKAELSPWLLWQERWENAAGDLVGLGWQALFRDAEPVRPLPSFALLRIDRDGTAINYAWQKDSLAAWRAAAVSQPFRLDRPWRGQVPPDMADKPLWLLLNCQMTELPTDVRSRQRLFLNFRGLPGRCVVYQNGVELIRKHELPPASFRVPIEIGSHHRSGDEDAPLTIVIQLVDGALRQDAAWPVWLSAPKD